MLTRGEDDSAESHHAFFTDGLTNHSERLLPHFAIWGDVVGIVKIQFVDFFLRDKLINLDGPLTLDGDGLKLLRLDLDVLALPDFVALDDFVGLDWFLGLGVDLQVLDAVARVLVDLMEADFLQKTSQKKIHWMCQLC